MQGGFSSKVLDVLSDPMNLPSEFLDYLVQHQAVNGIPTPIQSRTTTIASGTRTSNVSSSGTTFATGNDLLATSLAFTASGGNSYIVLVLSRGWNNSGTAGSASNELHFNLDGADAGRFAGSVFPAANQVTPLSVGGFLLTPAAGSHTLNVRLFVNSGTGTIVGGAGGAGNDVPLFVSISAI